MDETAFPCPGSEVWPVDANGKTSQATAYLIPASRGMTLRDYFAAQAMAGILASGPVHKGGDHVVHEAWCFANAMLAERLKTPAPDSKGTH